MIGLPLMTVILAAVRGNVTLATDLMLFLVATVAIAAIGGVAVAVVAAIGAFLLSNWYFTPPIHQWTIDEGAAQPDKPWRYPQE